MQHSFNPYKLQLGYGVQEQIILLYLCMYDSIGGYQDKQGITWLGQL